MKQVSRGVMFVIAALFAALSFAAGPVHPPMPPVFSATADPEDTLRQYPLGVILNVAAFSHHGPAHRKVKLPNGNEGWVYQVGEGAGLSTYTLELDVKGMVIDVLYNETGHRNGLTALQVQAQSTGMLGPNVEPVPPEKHAPEKFRHQP